MARRLNPKRVIKYIKRCRFLEGDGHWGKFVLVDKKYIHWYFRYKSQSYVLPLTFVYNNSSIYAAKFLLLSFIRQYALRKFINSISYSRRKNGKVVAEPCLILPQYQQNENDSIKIFVSNSFKSIIVVTPFRKKFIVKDISQLRKVVDLALSAVQVSHI